MITQNLPQNEQHIMPNFLMSQKKLVKTFIFQNNDDWIQYFTGFLFMEPSIQNEQIQIKIRFTRHSHLAQISSKNKVPLQIKTDQSGIYIFIPKKLIKTVQKPDPTLIYLRIGKQSKIIALSFYSQDYCDAVFQHLLLILQTNTQSNQKSWIQQNLNFMYASIKENLIYIDSIFVYEERVKKFCDMFNSVDEKLYDRPQKDLNSKKQQQMLIYFDIIKYMFIRGNSHIINLFIEPKYQFQTVLKCLSYNPFGNRQFNYLQQYKKTSKINNELLQFSKQFQAEYEKIIKIRFLKDVAICTFIQIPTQAVFNQLINEAHYKILQGLISNDAQMIKKLKQVAYQNEKIYLQVFIEVWQIYKAIMEDMQTKIIKEHFYLIWIQNQMFHETLSALGRLLMIEQVSDLHPRFWQRLLEAFNPMLSVQWKNSQQIIIDHDKNKAQNTLGFMRSLLSIFANCDSNTKIIILNFVRVQIETSLNRKQIQPSYLWHIYKNFIFESFDYCNNQEDIGQYLNFIQQIYVSQPIRTRHLLIQKNILPQIQKYMNNKINFIPIIKLLKTFIQVDNDDIFRYLDMIETFNCCRRKYAQNQHVHNITNSIFLSIFKAAQNIKSQHGKAFLHKIFFEDPYKKTQRNLEKIVEEEKQQRKQMNKKQQNIICQGQQKMDIEN